MRNAKLSAITGTIRLVVRCPHCDAEMSYLMDVRSVCISHSECDNCGSYYNVYNPLSDRVGQINFPRPVGNEAQQLDLADLRDDAQRFAMEDEA